MDKIIVKPTKAQFKYVRFNYIYKQYIIIFVLMLINRYCRGIYTLSIV